MIGGSAARLVRPIGLAVGVSMCVGAGRFALAVGDDQSSGVYGLGSDDETETVPSDATKDVPTSGTDSRNHTVRRGDTLWDISRTHFSDPWRWPKVWSQNPEIANPHWIFPGQTIRLHDGADTGGVTSSDSPEDPSTVVVTTGGLSHRPMNSSPEGQALRQIGFVDEGSLKGAGVINGSLEEKILLATGDHAYVEFPSGRAAQGGARYTVYQVDTEHPVREPTSNRVLGYLVHVYGDVVVDSVNDRPIANARLVDLTEPVERGYRVGAQIHQLKSVKPKHNQSDVTARIVASVEPSILIANQAFVVLNRGRRQGVEVGNRFLVLRQGDGIKRVMEDWNAVDPKFPPHAVAEIIAVDVQNETTIGWISRGTRDLHTGDLADLHRGY